LDEYRSNTMLEAITRPVVQVINSTYLLLLGIAQYLSFLDNPGMHIMIMVIGLVMVPFQARGIYHQYSHPHEYEAKTVVRSAAIGIAVIVFLVAFGYFNFVRFLPPPS
jgi:hypothetical protein